MKTTLCGAESFLSGRVVYYKIDPSSRSFLFHPRCTFSFELFDNNQPVSIEYLVPYHFELYLGIPYSTGSAAHMHIQFLQLSSCCHMASIS
jgi:hypothetical protein